MIKKWILISAIITLTTIVGHAQTEIDQIIEQVTQDLTENEIPESTIETIVSNLSDWATDKTNINQIDLKDLQVTGILSNRQISELNDYKSKNGYILSPYELYYLPSFTSDDVDKLTKIFAFGKMTKADLTLHSLKYGSHQILTQYNRTVEQPIGYENDKYPGTQGKKYFRYKYKRGKLYSIGFTAENDPGEAFLSSPNNAGFDFYSLHLFLHPKKIINTIALGDFQTTLGQGLVCGQGIWSSKTSNTLNIRNSKSGFKPYSGASEFGFMRGAGIELKFNKILSGIFLSYNPIDANIDTIDNKEYITSLTQNGFHRTESEINKKHSTTPTIMGAYVKTYLKNIQLSLNIINSHYDIPIAKSNQPYDLYDPEGDNFTNGSVSYLYQNKYFNLFGEVAMSDKNALANLHGISFAPTATVAFSLLYRNYNKKYYSPLSYGFAEGSSIQNEQGCYFGLEWLPFKRSKMNFYADFFKFPWLKFGEKTPTNGSEYLLNFTTSPVRNFTIQTKIKYESKLTSEVNNNKFSNSIKHNLHWRIQTNLRYSKIWTSKIRLALSHFKQNSTTYNGNLVYFEQFYNSANHKFSASGRVTIFDVDDYNARIYTYENDVLFSFSTPSFQNKGIRYYLNMSWQIINKLKLYTRIDRTYYIGASSISSGNEEINGNHKTTFHIKLKWSF